MTTTDLQFQNQRLTLRVAPWLDMFVLRENLESSFRTAIEGGDMSDYQEAYKQDLLEFCDGKRSRVPRCNRAREKVIRTISITFPVSDTDQGRDVAIHHIFAHIMEPRNWNVGNRGGGEPEVQQVLKTDELESDHDEDEGDCGGCGDCEICDGY